MRRKGVRQPVELLRSTADSDAVSVPLITHEQPVLIVRKQHVVPLAIHKILTRRAVFRNDLKSL